MFSTRLAATTCLLLAATSCLEAQVLLINPGDNAVGSSQLTGSTPLGVSSPNNYWNNGSLTYSSSIVYADNSAATGVSIVGSAKDISSGSAIVNFASPIGTAYPGGSGVSGLFADDPALDSVYTGNMSVTTPGVFALKVTGLTLNTTYNVYVAAAYLAGTVGARPGGGNSARQAVFGFAGTNASSLTYTAASGGATISGAGTPATGYQALTDTNNSSWVENNNFEIFQVTLTSANPALYILVTGDKSLVGLDTSPSTEQRPWLNFVQIVAVPEPGASVLLASILGLLICARRRRSA